MVTCTGHIGIHEGADGRTDVHDVMAIKPNFLTSMGYHIFLSMVLRARAPLARAELRYKDLWTILLMKAPYKEDLKDVLHLVEILLALLISAAQCERAISAQNRINRIKNDSRSCLGGQTVEELMRISLEGPSLANFDPEPAVKAWFQTSKRV